MRLYKPMGMLLLAGVALLALTATSASARTGDMTAEPTANTVVRAGDAPAAPPADVLTAPIVAPPVAPQPIASEPFPSLGPGAGGVGVNPIQFYGPTGIDSDPTPIDGNPSFGDGTPKDIQPIPIEPLAEIA